MSDFDENVAAILDGLPIPDPDDPVSPAERIAAGMLTTTELRQLPPPSPLIDGLVNLDSLAVLFGPSGSSKSFVGIDWALSVATGSWWHGRKVQPGPVVYIAAEGAHGIGARVNAWCSHHQVHDLDAHHPIHWLPRAVNLHDAAQAGALAEVCGGLGPVLVVIDTLARCSAGADENAAKDMGVIIAYAEQVKRATGATLLLIHHSGKDTANGARGSSALRAAVDTEIEVKGAEGRVVVASLKQKDGPEQLPIHLRHHVVGDSLVLVPAAPGDDRDDGLTPAMAATLDVLAAIEVPGGVSATTWMEATDTPRSTFHRHRARLIDHGAVLNVGTDRAPRYVTPPEQGK